MEPIKKFLPLSTVASVYAIFIGLFTKNLERVGRFMLIAEAPETKLD